MVKQVGLRQIKHRNIDHRATGPDDAEFEVTKPCQPRQQRDQLGRQTSGRTHALIVACRIGMKTESQSGQRRQRVGQHRIRRDALEALVVAITKGLAVVVGRQAG